MVPVLLALQHKLRVDAEMICGEGRKPWLCRLGIHQRATRLIIMDYGQAWEDWCPRCGGALCRTPFIGSGGNRSGDPSTHPITCNCRGCWTNITDGSRRPKP